MEQNQISAWKEFVGWYGVAAILGAYAAVSFEFVSAQGVIFQLVNASGALGIIIEAHAKKDMQPVVLNAVWLIIALVSLLRGVL